ncbi:MAG TPA: hypothetical protein DHW07_02620 [Gammaproteobacteria bacterium]|nr:hypothetical protein [Gammaproteobacteria bacterium]|tara:strand:+ start:403 stop:654 length:252 start_codon:yes stop_codon:yes gene_type:complete
MNAIRKTTTAVLSAFALVLGMTTTVQASLFNTSPIDTWEGAGAVFNNAGSSGVVVWFLILLALMVIVIISAAKTEKDHEREHG